MGLSALVDMIGEVSFSLVKKLAEEKYPIEFNSLQNILKNSLGRRLTTLERKYIHDAITAKACHEANLIREAEDFGQILNEEILIVTAYSNDYTLGSICEVINRNYASKHGYHFRAVCESYEHMIAAIHPRTHCTWYKVFLLLELLQKYPSSTYKYIMWIDADAVIVNHDQSIQHLLSLGRYRDLIVAEDMTQGCLINAGVMLLRNSQYSHQLWQQVWISDEVKRFHNVYFYEQSAVIKLLRSRGNNLTMFKPFHSYCGGELYKILPHIAVLPHCAMNTNHGYHEAISKVFLFNLIYW